MWAFSGRALLSPHHSIYYFPQFIARLNNLTTASNGWALIMGSLHSYYRDVRFIKKWRVQIIRTSMLFYDHELSTLHWYVNKEFTIFKPAMTIEYVL